MYINFYSNLILSHIQNLISQPKKGSLINKEPF